LATKNGPELTISPKGSLLAARHRLGCDMAAVSRREFRSSHRYCPVNRRDSASNMRALLFCIIALSSPSAFLRVSGCRIDSVSVSYAQDGNKNQPGYFSVANVSSHMAWVAGLVPNHLTLNFKPQTKTTPLIICPKATAYLTFTCPTAPPCSAALTRALMSRPLELQAVTWPSLRWASTYTTT
jgi:hypothetical protein